MPIARLIGSICIFLASTLVVSSCGSSDSDQVDVTTTVSHTTTV